MLFVCLCRGFRTYCDEVCTQSAPTQTRLNGAQSHCSAAMLEREREPTVMLCSVMLCYDDDDDDANEDNDGDDGKH